VLLAQNARQTADCGHVLPIRQPALAVRKVFAVGVVRGRRAQQIEDRGLAVLEDRHALAEDVVLDHLEQPARADERAPEFGVDGQRERVSNELGKHSRDPQP
jgi:hypothetical protein